MNTLSSKQKIGSACSKCGSTLRYIKSGACVACMTIRCKAFHQANREKKLMQMKAYGLANRERKLAADRARYAMKREEIRLNARLSRNDEVRRKEREYREKRMAEDPTFAMAARLRSRLATFMKKAGMRKRSHMSELLGCTKEEFKIHVERQFLPGMTWDNRRLWHLDHIVPLATAKSIEELEKLCHVSNIRPMWAEANQAKSGKVLNLI